MSHGDGRNVPAQITQRLGPSVASRIIYWSLAEENVPIACFVCMETSSQLAFLPCFWPHLIILSPLFLSSAFAVKAEVKGSYAILTDSTLYILSVNGGTISLALESIREIRATRQADRCSCCAPELSRIIIDDGTISTGRHQNIQYKTIYGHQNIEEFARLILETKERKTQMNLAMQPLNQMQPGMVSYPPQYPQMQPVMAQNVTYPQPALPSAGAPVYQMVPMNSNPNEYPNYNPNAYPNK